MTLKKRTDGSNEVWTEVMKSVIQKIYHFISVT